MSTNRRANSCSNWPQQTYRRKSWNLFTSLGSKLHKLLVPKSNSIKNMDLLQSVGNLLSNAICKSNRKRWCDCVCLKLLRVWSLNRFNCKLFSKLFTKRAIDWGSRDVWNVTNTMTNVKINSATKALPALKLKIKNLFLTNKHGTQYGNIFDVYERYEKDWWSYQIYGGMYLYEHVIWISKFS